MNNFIISLEGETQNVAGIKDVDRFCETWKFYNFRDGVK